MSDLEFEALVLYFRLALHEGSHEVGMLRHKIRGELINRRLIDE